eukprot:SAG22_NODE_14322_length_377_cov_1.669065_2_plen_53_part_01
MRQLHAKFGKAGALRILALPSDQFGAQELDTAADVAEFAAENGPFPPHTVMAK